MNCFENEQKELLMENKQLKSEIKRLKLKNSNIDTTNWRKWDHQQILCWILSLENGRYFKYENKLQIALKEESVNGNNLNQVNELDIKGWGITNFDDKKNLCFKIQQLIKKNFNNDMNEGSNLPTAYI